MQDNILFPSAKAHVCPPLLRRNNDFCLFSACYILIERLNEILSGILLVEF